MILGALVGLKGRATRAGEPVSALDPAALTQVWLGMPFRARSVRRPNASFQLRAAARGDISNGEKKCLFKRAPTCRRTDSK